MWRLSQLMRAGAASGIVPEQALLLALPVAFLHRLPLVVHLLAPRQCQLDLRPPGAVEIHRKRNQRQPLARLRAVQLGDFAVLEQQFPRPPRVMVETIAVAVFGDMAVDQPYLFTLGRGIALGDRALALAQRFHLGPGELDPGLEALLDEIVKARAPVFGADFL